MGKLRHGATKRGTAGDAQHDAARSRTAGRHRVGVASHGGGRGSQWPRPHRGASEMRMYRACAGLAGTCPRRVGSVGGGGWRPVRAGGGRRYPEHPSIHPSLASHTPLSPEHPSLAPRVPCHSPSGRIPSAGSWRGGAVGAASCPPAGGWERTAAVLSPSQPRGVPYGLGPSRAAVAVRLLGC